jgi:predicted dehydrogenase
MRFMNGALADVRSSRVSMKKMRKIRLFQGDGYVSIDYGANTISIFRKSEAFRSGAIDPQTLDPRDLEDPFKFVFGQLLEVQEHSLTSTDALRDQLTSFLEACRGEHPPVVPGEDGLRAVRLADRVQAEVQTYLAREAARAGIQLPSRAGEADERFQGRRTDRLRDGQDEAPPPAGSV